MSHRRAPPPHIPLLTEDTAPVHFEWSKITVWRTVYQTKPKKGKRSKQDPNFSRVSRGNKKSKKPTLRSSQKRPQYTVTIFSLERPKRQKILKTPSGKRVFEAVSCKREERGFIEKIRNIQPRTVYNPQGINQTMGKSKDTTAEKTVTRAKAKNKKTKAEDEGTADDDSVEEELAALEALADDALDEDVTTDEDPEEAPKKGKSKKPKERQSRAAKEGKVGTREIAEAGDTDSRTLRMVLRKHGPDGTGEIDKDPETGRWEWDSLDHKDVRKILGWLKRGEAKDVKNESLQKLKDQKAKEKAEGKKGKKDKKKNKKKD